MADVSASLFETYLLSLIALCPALPSLLCPRRLAGKTLYTSWEYIALEVAGIALLAYGLIIRKD